MSSYVVQVRVVGHTQNKRESIHEEAELEAEAKKFVEHLLDLGHVEIVAGLRIDGASAIDLVPKPPEEEPPAPPEEEAPAPVAVAEPRVTRKR